MSNKAYNNIAKVIKKRGMTQQQLAEMSYIHQNTISCWCKQKRQPPLDMLFLIAELLDVSVLDLINVDRD